MAISKVDVVGTQHDSCATQESSITGTTKVSKKSSAMKLYAVQSN
jgi:hypothetical protein